MDYARRIVPDHRGGPAIGRVAMGLRLKFNVVLTLVFAAGMAVSAWVSHELLQRNAKHEVQRNAGLMMEAALAIRGYTVSHIRPHLADKLHETFLPQTVPAFAA